MANPKVLGTLALIILLLGGFMSLKNMQAYENEIAQTKVEAHNLALSRARLKKAEDALADTIAKKEGVLAEVATLETDEANQKKLNFDLKAELDEKTGKVADLQGSAEEMAEAQKKLVRMQEVADQCKRLKEEIGQLDAVIKENEAEEARLIAANTDMEGQIDFMRKDAELRAGGKSMVGLETRIRAVYPTWGFVTLESGDKAGVVLNSTLCVVRDGEVVCRLYVATVERNTASANIVPDSLAPDTVLMVGDLVGPWESMQRREEPVATASTPGKPAEGLPGDENNGGTSLDDLLKGSISN